MQILESLQQRTLFGIRSPLYGAAMMFDNGELYCTPENLESVRRLANHEIDLPKPRSQKSAPPFWQSALQTIRYTNGVTPKKAASFSFYNTIPLVAGSAQIPVKPPLPKLGGDVGKHLFLAVFV